MGYAQKMLSTATTVATGLTTITESASGNTEWKFGGQIKTLCLEIDNSGAVALTDLSSSTSPHS